MKTLPFVFLAALATVTNGEIISEVIGISISEFFSMDCGIVGENSTLTMGFTARGATVGGVVFNANLFYNWGSESYAVNVTDSAVGNPAETNRSSVVATWTQGEDFLNFTAVETYVYSSGGVFDTELGMSNPAVDSKGQTWPYSKVLRLAKMLVEEDNCLYDYKTPAPSASPSGAQTPTPSSGALKAGEGRFYLAFSLMVAAFLAAGTSH
ncbi:hypothetical protein ACHAWF_000957 [Thalassiosira exigua]